MSTPAVTRETPAVSEHRSKPRKSDHADILSTDKHYLLTGERPESRQRERDTEEENQSENEDASAVSETENETENQSENEDASAVSGDADTRAASAAASTQKTNREQEAKGKATTKNAQTSETRWQKRERELKEARAENARLKAQLSQPQTRSDNQQVSQPAAEAKTEATANPRPKIDDVDPKTNKPKYTTYQQYEDAKDEWNRKEAVREFQETHVKTERERQQREQHAEIGRNLAKKFETARAKHADFDTVALGEHLLIPAGSVTDGFLIESEHAGEVAYYLGQHPEITQGFYKDFDPKTGRFVNVLPPQQQFRKLMAIEAEVSGAASSSSNSQAQSRSAASSSSSAKPITQAGRPPNQVSGKGTVAKDAIEQALEDNDQETFRREMNNRDPRLKAVLAARKGK